MLRAHATVVLYNESTIVGGVVMRAVPWAQHTGYTEQYRVDIKEDTCKMSLEPLGYYVLDPDN